MREDLAVLGEIEDMRRDLKYRLAEPHRWDGALRKHLQARAIQGSNSIEGYRASVEDVESIMSGDEPTDATPSVTREILGYRQALTYIGELARASVFAYDAGLLHSLNFMMIGHHLNKSPGTVRPGGIYVRNSLTGEVVYEGPDAPDVPELLGELVAWLNTGDLDQPSYVRAAMAHFNLVSIHPWRDGNGRMSRALQTLVLGRGQILTPEFCSIEEWLGIQENTVDYYRVLSDVRRGWTPHSDTLPWVRFCLRAHHMQAQRVRRRLADASEVWLLLEEKAEADGLNTRCVSAMYQVFVSTRLRRTGYQQEESLSQGQATRDMRELAEKGWLASSGETKARFYAPGPRMLELKAAYAQRIQVLVDPYRKG
ncbi:Fic family protein [Acrocarpospora pleiomorpha]